MEYPAMLVSRLRDNVPEELTVLGNLDLLRTRKTALFCSARPGDAILRAHDAARIADMLMKWKVPLSGAS